MNKLENKICVITGTSYGLGKQTAIRFAEEGAKAICICSRTEDKLMDTKRICEEKGAEVLALVTDVSKEAQIKEFTNAIASKYNRIDVLCNNAATISEPRPFLELTTEQLDESIYSGLYATWHMMQQCFPMMKKNGGSIINYGSMGGVIGLEGNAAYASSKEAIRALSRVVAREWGRYNIRVNTICPNVATDRFLEGINQSPKELQERLIGWMSQNAMHRMGMAYEDATPAIVFLASDDSHWITGQTLHVEGGNVITA